MIRIALALLALLFAGPLLAQEAPEDGFNPDSILALKGLQLLDKRMNAIGSRLVEANTPFCTGTVAPTGTLLPDVNQYPDQSVARFSLCFAGPVADNAVAPASEADTGGLMPGGAIL